MIYYRIEWGKWGEDSDWNTIYIPYSVYNFNFQEEKTVDELEQIVYQKILNDKSDYKHLTKSSFLIKELILGEILKSNSVIKNVDIN